MSCAFARAFHAGAAAVPTTVGFSIKIAWHRQCIPCRTISYAANLSARLRNQAQRGVVIGARRRLGRFENKAIAGKLHTRSRRIFVRLQGATAGA
jgi:hypothetical protein